MSSMSKYETASMHRNHKSDAGWWAWYVHLATDENSGTLVNIKKKGWQMEVQPPNMWWGEWYQKFWPNTSCQRRKSWRNGISNQPWVPSCLVLLQARVLQHLHQWYHKNMGSTSPRINGGVTFLFIPKMPQSISFLGSNTTWHILYYINTTSQILHPQNATNNS